jgi:hypothetical protein
MLIINKVGLAGLIAQNKEIVILKTDYRFRRRSHHLCTAVQGGFAFITPDLL